MGTALLTLLIFLPVVGSPTRATENPAPELRIRVLPPTVYVRTRIKLALNATPPLPERARISWQADGGNLLFDDLADVEWKTPRQPGAYPVSVRVAVGDKTWQLRTVVNVKKPSTDGMVWIPPGVFIQGDQSGTRDTEQVKTFQNTADEPFRPVRLQGYWIDRYPVTHGQYRAFLNDLLTQGLVRVEPLGVFGEFEGSWVPFYYFKSYEELAEAYLSTVNSRKPHFLHWISWNADERTFELEPDKEDFPIVDVSWFGAVTYARFHGKHLPTESQWEKSARGTDARKFPWGDHVPTVFHGNINYARGSGPSPIGAFSPHSDSPYGVVDLMGGLFEWTDDWFNGQYYDDRRSRVADRDPVGTFWGPAHIIRGFPYGFNYPGILSESTDAIGFRYAWHFEFYMGDIFANRRTTFRAAISGVNDHPNYDDPF